MYRAELLKLRTTRAAWVIAAVALGGMLLVQAVSLVLPQLLERLDAAGVTSDADLPPDVAGDLTAMLDVAQPAFQRSALDLLAAGPGGTGSTGVTAICMLLLGVLAVTADFRHGGIVPTALVRPSRLAILGAKAGAVATAAVVIGVGLAVLSALGLTVALAAGDAPLVLSAAEVLGVWGRGLAVLALFAWIGLGIGTLVRNQVAAVVVVVAAVLVEPIVQALVMLLSDGTSNVASWMPQALGSIASTGLGASTALGAAAALAGLALWATALLAGGAASLRSRDLV
ncbi:hypothetical protein [Oerskovia flava]|uniref:hypothetical protein n=1 Tax=Oerskovia flava TaxID=2986422 RepID=UPI0022405D57|nr:hypothetical protein [Oerskovia sp. JB1-3-2]